MLSLFRKSKKTNQGSRRSAAQKRTQRSRRRLAAECLEGRQLLAGVVGVDTSVPGNLSLTGDVSNNQVEVHGTATTGEFVVMGTGGTLLTLNGGLLTFSSLTINGITKDINVDLGQGQDTFELGNATDPTNVGFNVNIKNTDDDTNILTNVDIGEQLNVQRTDIAFSELEINGSIIRDNMTVDNGNGDTKTVLNNSEVEGLLQITNGNGDDLVVVNSTSVGAAQFYRPGGPGTLNSPVVSITNGDGSSLTSFTDANDPDTTGFLPTGTLNRPTVYGGIDITNGDQLPAGLIVPPPTAGGSLPTSLAVAIDMVVMNKADVLGHLNINNYNGHTETLFVDSNIGTDNKARDMVTPANGGYGDAVQVTNGDGFDVLLAQGSTMQYGLNVDNGTGTWGSQTDIRDSRIGGRDGTVLPAGTALMLTGDDGDDVFNLSDAAGGSEFDGDVLLTLGNGEDSVMMQGASSALKIDNLEIDFGLGDDMLYMENVTVDACCKVQFGDGADTMELRAGVILPSSLTGITSLDGGAGADYYHVDSLTIPFINFETMIP